MTTIDPEPTPRTTWADRFTLTTAQQIRLETARMLLPEWTNMVSRQDEGDEGTIVDFTNDMLLLANAIETGADFAVVALVPLAAVDDFLVDPSIGEVRTRPER